jgi:tetratricopeptide (TPR) repeat protein
MRLHILAMAMLLTFPSHLVLAKSPGESGAARTERTKGTVALNLGQYEEAIEHLSQAYTLTQDPILLFSLGQAFRLAGKPDKAVASYSSFLRAAGPGTKYRTQFDRAAAEIETITPTLVCPPREHAGTGKQPDDAKQLDDLMNAPAPATKHVAELPVEPIVVAEPIEPPPAAAQAPQPPVLAPSPPAAPAPALALTTQATPVEPEAKPVYKKAWFWSSVVGVLAVGAVATWWFTRSQNNAPPSTYGSTRVLP